MHSLKKYKEAKKYYEMAIEKGCVLAAINLGYLYHYGFGVEQDYAKAKKYYEMVIKKVVDMQCVILDVISILIVK